jgi:hypothetical protein
MWTLLIVSMVFATDDTIEPRVTEYSKYETKQECFVEWYKVSSEFTQGETAWCEGTDE